MLRGGHDAVGVRHAEPEPGKGVSGQLAHGRRHVRRTVQRIGRRLRRRREVSPGAGVRRDSVEDDRAERRAVRVGRVRRFVERPAPEAQTVHSGTRSGRVRGHGRPTSLRLLLLRVSHGSDGRCGSRTCRPHRWRGVAHHIRVQLRRRRYHGKCS